MTSFFNMNTMSTVLRRSVVKRRSVKGEPSFDRQLTNTALLDKKADQSAGGDKRVILEESRSSSQASGAVQSTGSVISEYQRRQQCCENLSLQTTDALAVCTLFASNSCKSSCCIENRRSFSEAGWRCLYSVLMF